MTPKATLNQTLVLAALLTGGCDIFDRAETNTVNSSERVEVERKRDQRLRQACASQATYARLKEIAFDEAARIRGDDAVALDRVAQAAVVRMENPRVESRDDSLNLTVCQGRFVLELPPGSENAFDGERRVAADVEYAAQDAADGSGVIFQMEGAEPIIYRLATIGGVARGRTAAASTSRPPVAPEASVEREVAEAAPAPRPVQPRPAAEPAPRAARPAPPSPPIEPEPRPVARADAGARPSFNCRAARTRTEQLICSNGRLAAQDRRMASVYYAEMANADPETRRQLRQSRNRFLSRRERCGSEECVSDAYAERVAEIRAIAGR